MGKQHGGAGMAKPESGCVYSLCVEERENLRAQVARLEAEAAPLRAALIKMGHEFHRRHHPYTMPQPICGIEPCGEANRALSSDAGKGWLSPEAVKWTRRQAGDAFITWAEANKSRIHADALDEAAMGFAAGHTAALDALKGVE